MTLEGRVVIDPRRRLPGRGAYLHVGMECIERGLRRGGIARGLGVTVRPEDADLLRKAAQELGSAATDVIGAERQ